MSDWHEACKLLMKEDFTPRFDFRCSQCRAFWPDIHTHWYDEPFFCPTCGAPLDKLPAAPNFTFKGSGFYHNDYGPGKDQPKS